MFVSICATLCSFLPSYKKVSNLDWVKCFLFPSLNLALARTAVWNRKNAEEKCGDELGQGTESRPSCSKVNKYDSVTDLP